MRHPVRLLLLLPLAACGEAPEPPPPPPPPPTYADFAGAWDGLSTMTGTPDPVPARFASTPQGGGWTMTFEGRDPVAMRVSLAGDSLILVSEPYASVLRDNVQVQVRVAAVLQDGALAGKVIATYDTPDGQEVVMGTLQATRAPATPDTAT